MGGLTEGKRAGGQAKFCDAKFHQFTAHSSPFTHLWHPPPQPDEHPPEHPLFIKS